MNIEEINFFEDNYKKEKLTFNLAKLNLFAVLFIIPAVLIFVLPYYCIWHQEITFEAFRKFATENYLSKNAVNYSFFLVFIMLLGIILHELIHGITFSLFAKSGFKAIKFGVLWKMLTPYCHCKEPLLIKHYIIGAIMPTVILGLIPFLYSIIFGNIFFLIFAVFFIIAAFGDFYIIFSLRNEDKNNMVFDHPSEVGCFIYRKM